MEQFWDLYVTEQDIQHLMTCSSDADTSSENVVVWLDRGPHKVFLEVITKKNTTIFDSKQKQMEFS